MKGSNPKIHSPSDTFELISIDRVVDFMKVAIGFATELSLFQQSSQPANEERPKLTFPNQGEPRITGQLVSKKEILITYDMNRMTKSCEQLTVCFRVGRFGSKSCKTMLSVASTEFLITVPNSGTVFLTFESFGANGFCASDSGYQFKFE